MLAEMPLSRRERGTFLAQVELFPVGKGTHCTSTTSSERDSISATQRHCLLQEWYFAAGNAIKQRRKRCHLQQEQNFFQVLEAKNHSISSSITNKRKGHHLVKYWWKATLFWQLEDSFPLLSAEERDCIYNKSYIVNSSTSAIISRKKRHNLLLHQCHLQQQQHIFQQQMEMSLTERAKYIFGSKSVTMYGSSWRCQ